MRTSLLVLVLAACENGAGNGKDEPDAWARPDGWVWEVSHPTDDVHNAMWQPDADICGDGDNEAARVCLGMEPDGTARMVAFNDVVTCDDQGSDEHAEYDLGDWSEPEDLGGGAWLYSIGGEEWEWRAMTHVTAEDAGDEQPRTQWYVKALDWDPPSEFRVYPGEPSCDGWW